MASTQAGRFAELFAGVEVDPSLFSAISAKGSDPEVEALRLAVYLRNIEIFSRILEEISDENLKTALLFTADRGWLTGVKKCLNFLLLPGRDLEPELAARALECAARRSHFSVVSRLLAASGTIAPCTFELAIRGDLVMRETIERLIAGGFKAESFGETLMRAACGRRYLAAQALLEVCEIPRIMTREFLVKNPEFEDYLSDLIDEEFALSCPATIAAKISAANPEAGEKIVALRAAHSTAR